MRRVNTIHRCPMAAVSLLTVVLAAASWAASAEPADKPGIIVVMIDNIGYGDFGFSGNEKARTPHLDRFAAEGIRFSRFNCNPMCAPTRASIMTGRYHYRTGVIHTSRGGALMHGDEVTVAEYLKRAGYATAHTGKWHLGDCYPMRPQDQGFDETLWHKSGRIGQVPDLPNPYIGPTLWHNGRKTKSKDYCTDVFFDAAIRFIEANRHRPFFIYLPTNVGHTAKESIVGPLVPARYSEPFREMGLGETNAKIYGMVANFDENFGRLIAKLDELGIRKDTLVIFTSDDGPGHGYNAGLRTGTIYEARMRVPFIVQWPNRLQGNRTIDRIASHIDVLPTCLELAGMPIPPEPVVDGVSLLPLLRGDAASWPERKLFLQCHRGLQPKRYQNCAVITQRYKLVGYPGKFDDENLVASRDNPVLELYDLIEDPAETTDLAKTKPAVTASLRAAYDAWFDDVKKMRQFVPGHIHLGSDQENPVHLCRYQDSAYIDGKPTGWGVFVERTGDYEITINRGDATAPGEMCVRVNDAEQRKLLKEGGRRAVFELPSGEATLDVWVEETGTPYTPRSEEDTIGDVDVRRL